MLNVKNKKRATTKEQDNVVSLRIVLYLLGATVSIPFLSYLHRLVIGVSTIPRFNDIVNAMLYIFGACVVASFVWLFFTKGKEKDTSLMVVTPVTATVVSVAVFFSFLFIKYFYVDAIRLFFLLIPGLCILYIVRQIFGRGFFHIGAYLSIAATMVYVFDRLLQVEALSNFTLLFGGTLLIFGIEGIMVATFCKKNNGIIKRFKNSKKSFVVFDSGAKIAPAYIAAFTVTGIGLLFITSPSAAVYYGLAALGALILLLAIYFTYNLMYQ